MIIYLATNAVNGKRYIGATVKSLVRRKGEHIIAAKRGAGYMFHKAIRKYGEDAFQWTILKRCSSRDELMKEEIRLIADLRPEYNITVGGRGIVGVPRTEEWKKKISKAQKGRKLSPERRAALKAAFRPESIYRSVVCLHDGKWFESIKGAAKHYGISVNNVRSVANGSQTIAKGLSFVYSKTPLSAEECAAHLLILQGKRDKAMSRRKSGHRNRSVICINDGREFRSAVAAERELGLPKGRVRQACGDGGQTAGLRFRYLDDPDPPAAKIRTKEQLIADRAASLAALQRGQKKIKKTVMCVDTGVIYESITAAAKACGAHISSVSTAIHRKGRAKGFAFRFVK